MSDQRDGGTLEELARLRKQVECLTKSLDERQRLVDCFERTVDLWCITDRAGYIQRAGGNWKDAIGKDGAALQGSCLLDHAHPDDRDDLESVMSLGSHMFVCRFRHANQSYRWIAWSSYAQHDQVFLSGQDIHDHKQAEHEAERSRLLLEAVVDQCPVPLVVVEAKEGRITHVSKASEDLYNTRRDQFIGLSLAEVPSVQPWRDYHPDGRPVQPHELPIVRALQGTKTDRQEIKVVRADGSERWELVDGTPIFDSDGTLQAALIAFPDITERRKTELALREREQRLALVLQGSEVGTWDWNVQTREMRCDERMAHMLGYQLDEIERHSASWLQLVHPEDAGVLKQAVEQHLVSDEMLEREYRCIHKSGSIVWILGRGKVIARDATGRALRAVGTHVDITTRKRAVDQLMQLAEEQQKVLHTVSLGIIYLRDRRIQWVNHTLARMFGYRIQELQDVHVSKFYANQHDCDRVGTEGYRALAATGTFTDDVLMCRKDGSQFWVCVTGQPINTNNLAEGSIWAVQDITERRRAQEALAQVETRFQRLVEHSADIIAVAGPDGELKSLVGAVESALGYQSVDLLRTNLFDYVHPSEKAAATASFAELLAHPPGIRRLACRLRHKRGTWVWIETVATNLLHDPMINGVVINIRDISERVRLQDQLQQAMKMEAVGRLAGGVAHDFNNLLTAILGNVDLAQLDMADADPLVTTLDQIRQAAESATSVTRQLLAFSRRQIIEPVALNLNDLITGIKVMLGRLIGEDIVLQAQLHPALGSVKVDRGQFEQVIMNLVVNARDAMPKGGRITIETNNVDLDPSYRSRHPDTQLTRCVQLCVTDTGAGMSDEVKGHLFEPFFTTKAKGRGTGLGLATIFGVVKQAGGNIEVDSEPGLGSSFKIYLPRVDEPAGELACDRSSQTSVTGTETILVVEDEDSVRGVVRAILERLGYRVLEACDAREALALADRHTDPISLLMTDVVMPGMNGRELADHLRASHPETKVLFTSGYTEDVIVHHGVLDENLQFIGKPYAFQALAKKVREVIDS